MYRTELCGETTCAVFSLDDSGDPAAGEIVIPMIDLASVASKIGVSDWSSQVDLMRRFNFGLTDFVLIASDELFQAILASYCRFVEGESDGG